MRGRAHCARYKADEKDYFDQPRCLRRIQPVGGLDIVVTGLIPILGTLT